MEIIEASFVKGVWCVTVSWKTICIEMDEIKELEKKYGKFDSIHFNDGKGIQLYFYKN